MLIEQTNKIIVTDGAASLLYNSPHRSVTNLYAIIGDMESLEGEVREYYQSKGVNIIYDSDQDTNDFEKAVALAHSKQWVSLVCLGALGGRIDQQLCNLSAIEKLSKQNNQRFIALGISSLMFLIKDKETAQIRINKRCETTKVGIFCFGKSSVYT